MTIRLERREPGATTTDRPRSNLRGTWTIDPAHSSVAFTRRALRLWTITGRRHCTGVIHLMRCHRLGPSGSTGGGRSTARAWRSCPAAPGGSWRPSPPTAPRGWSSCAWRSTPSRAAAAGWCCGGGGAGSPGLGHRQAGLALPSDDPARPGRARATRVETRASTESHEADLHHQHAALSRLLDRLAHEHELVHEIPACPVEMPLILA
jgi:hypothetical protein